MYFKPIETDKEYRDALREIEGLMQAQASTPEGQRLEALTALVQTYEAKQFPMNEPDSIKDSTSEAK